MPSDKYMYYSYLAEKTVEDLTYERGKWVRFLETSARLYKYPFPDQLLIFAQRPDTIACAPIEVWNDTFNRWVMRGSKGIALLDNSCGKPLLKYVFDVADTEPLRLNARPVTIWKMKLEHREAVLNELAKSYEGVTDTLSGTFHNIARELAVEYYDDNTHDIKYKAEESFLGHIPVYDSSGSPVEGDDSHLRAAFINNLSRSIEFSLMSRCGLGSSKSFDEDEFENIYQFNTPEMVYALGTAVSDLSEQVLRDIETVIKKYERMQTAERSEQDYDRNPYLQNTGRLPAPEHHLDGATAGTDGNSGQIREDAQELSERTQDDQLQSPATDRETLPAPTGRGRSGDETDGTNDERVDSENQIAEQRIRSDGMDSSDERIESTSGGNSPTRTGLQLDPTISQLGKSSIEALLSTSPITLDEVDTILRDGGNEKHSHLRIAAHFSKSLSNNSEFLRYEYLHGRFFKTHTETGKGYIFGNKKVAAWYSKEGILLNVGDSARYNRSSILIPWEHAAARINNLMIIGKYVSGNVLDEALENERFELAYKINDFYRDGMDIYPEEWKAERSIRPDEINVLQNLLRDANNHQAILDRLEQDSLVWYNSPDKRRWVDPERALISMREIMNPPVLSAIYGIQNQKDFNYFITDDEVNSFLISKGLFNEWKYQTLSFFLRNNNPKDRADFIKNRYGQSGGTWSEGDGGYDATPSGGLEFKRGRLLEPSARTKINWNNAAKRIENLIKEGHFINRNEFDNLKKYELLELARSIKNFHSDLPDEYERPFNDDINFNYPDKEEWDAIHELLDDSELVAGLYQQMYHIFENTSENDRYYKIRKEGYDRLFAYREGTYNLFPGIDPLFDKGERQYTHDSVIVLDEPQLIEPHQEIEQFSLFGMFEPLPTVDQQIERIDRTLYDEAQQIKQEQEAEVEKPSVLSLPKGLDALLLGASEENKEKIAEQFATNPRSREAVNLVKDIYGEFNGVSIKQTIARISELIEDGKYLHIPEHSEELGPEATNEEIYTEITDPEIIAHVNEIFGDNKPDTVLDVEDKIRDVLTSRGYAVSDELIDDGISKFITQGNTGNIEEISNFIEDEFLSDETVQEIYTEQSHIKTVPAQNFRIIDDNLGEGSAKAKYRNNINALQTLFIIENENRNATPEEQEILSRYVGWGGLPQAFDKDNPQWTNEYNELNNLLAPEEWESARASTLNAHYTTPTVIKAMYETIERLGFKSGNVLEPSCGVGNFLGMLPDSMQSSKIYGVELDGITARIAKQLYPNVNIQHTGFERADFPDAFFDIAIGNVPFGNYGVVDSRYDKHKFSLHNYFFAKAIDKVRPGGIIAFITSKYTMDEKNPKVRRYIAERAELLGAVRLPNNAFLKNAGTETTMDILILQKRDRPLDIEPEWVHLGLTDDGIPVNRYFIDNPEMLLGKMALDERMNNRYGSNANTTCLPLEDANLANQLDVALSFIDGQITIDELDDLDGIDNHAIPADPLVKNFSYALVSTPETDNTGSLFGKISNSRVYFRENSLMYPVDLPATTLERIKGMIALRDCVQKLIMLQVDEHTDDEIKAQQCELNRLYDRFTSDYGLINSSANNKAFNADSSYYLLCSLEIINEDGELDRKADMFTKRTIKQKSIITRVDTASEALAVSIAEKACVDLEYMSEISQLSREKLIADLEGVIFLNIGSAGLQHETYVTADEYLSGNVRKKLELANAAAGVDPKLEINAKALEAIQPKDLEASEISVRLGATWIEPDYINEFMHELLDVSWRMKDVYKVNYHPITDTWQVTNKGRALFSDINACVTYGTFRANAFQIIDDCLNLRDVRVYDYKDDADGKTIRVLNKKETTLAQQKQELIKQKFQDWIWKEPERRHTLVRLYNERFNSNRPREYDGSHIQFVGANPDIAFHPHQINAVARQIYGGNTLLAHVVGAGKTFEMVGAAMESKRLGLCHKSLFSVPNHLTEQWGTEFLRLYPNANILVARKKDFEMRNRKKFCAKIATGDYDAVIIGHSQLEKIPMSRERQERLLNEQIWEIQSGIDELVSARGERWSVKQLERTKKQLQVRLAKLLDSKKRDDVVTYEQLGVDRLFVDEAHNFKNLFMFTKMRNAAGLSTSEAQKSSDLFLKCRYMDELTDNKGVIFASGTPISNSMTEMYTMQRYLQYDKLQEKGLTHFDCWASIFGETQTSIELAPEGTGYRARTRFAKFHNLPELMSMFKEIADIQTADMINLPVPDAKFDTIIVEPSDIQKEMVQELSERAAAVQARHVDPTIDNMLKITTDGRKIGLDQRLMNPLLPDYEGSKVNACTENVFNIWNATSKDRLTQLVFCDFSTPNKDGRFNVYDDMRAKLIERGIPESEVDFIHNADSDTKKKELFAKVRQGKVRVLFGSTFKMGSGTNVQDRLIAIHDADCPWRPADLEQRAGRIIRQGNQNPEVLIFRYATNGTFDSYLWQTVQKKQEFIAQIMTSKSPVRSCEDVDETALSYAEIKALCAGNPLIAEKMNLDIEVTKLRMLKSEHQSQRYRLEDDIIANFPRKIAAVTERITGIEKDAKAYAVEKAKYTEVKMVSGNASDSTKFPGMTINDITYNEKEPAAKALLEACKGIKGRGEKDIGVYMGFELCVRYGDTQVKLLIRRVLTYQIYIGVDPFGNITRINNALDSLPDKLDGAKDELANIQRQQEAAKLELEKPFALSGELAEKEARLAMLNAELNIEGEGYFDIVDNNGERSSDEEEPDTDDNDESELDEDVEYEYSYTAVPQLVTAKSTKPSILEGIRDFDSSKNQSAPNKDKPVERGI